MVVDFGFWVWILFVCVCLLKRKVWRETKDMAGKRREEVEGTEYDIVLFGGRLKGFGGRLTIHMAGKRCNRSSN